MGRHTTKLGESSRAQTRPPLPYAVNDGRVAPPVKAAMERRSQRRRSRLAALSAASMLAVGGAAGMSMAMADEPEAAKDGEVVFSGGCGTLGLLAPTSRPNADELTVAEGSRVTYANDLGTEATLHVGAETYAVEAGATRVFAMNQSAEVAMVPDCRGLFADYDAAQVTVVAAPADEGGADESDESDDAAAELPSRGSGSGSESEGADGAPTDDDRSEPGGAGHRGEDPDGPGEPEEPEATDDALEDALDAEDAEVDSFGGTGPSTGADDSELAPAADEVAVVDPKAVGDGASGLLALVAIVCLVGVAAAVMRTLLKQRVAA